MKPTREYIRERARDHVAYGWTRSPGTHDRNIEWTEEHTAIYNEEYDRAKAEATVKPANPHRQPPGDNPTLAECFEAQGPAPGVVEIRQDSGAIGRIWEKRLGVYGWAHPNGSEGEARGFRAAEDELAEADGAKPKHGPAARAEAAQQRAQRSAGQARKHADEARNHARRARHTAASIDAEHEEANEAAHRAADGAADASARAETEAFAAQSSAERASRHTQETAEQQSTGHDTAAEIGAERAEAHAATAGHHAAWAACHRSDARARANRAEAARKASR